MIRIHARANYLQSQSIFSCVVKWTPSLGCEKDIAVVYLNTRTKPLCLTEEARSAGRGETELRTVAWSWVEEGGLQHIGIQCQPWVGLHGRRCGWLYQDHVSGCDKTGTGGRWLTAGSGGHDEPVPTLRYRVTPTIIVGWARLLVPTKKGEGSAPGCRRTTSPVCKQTRGCFDPAPAVAVRTDAPPEGEGDQAHTYGTVAQIA